MKSAILNTLEYSALFSHPMTKNEVFHFLRVQSTSEDFDHAFNNLLLEKSIISDGEYVQIAQSKNFLSKRKTREERAKDLLLKSTKFARIIASFPFVRSIAISGSVSKLSAQENADLDFFIITSKNRLWIARTLLHLFKKLTFITGHQHFFCMNYFISEDQLTLPFRNIYTAIELKTLIPVFGKNLIEDLINENSWTTEFLPNHDNKPLASATIVDGNFALKGLFESIINMLFPEKVNERLMNLTASKWKRKFANMNLDAESYDRAFMTRIHLSKNHPHDYQQKVMKAIKDKAVLNPTL